LKYSKFTVFYALTRIVMAVNGSQQHLETIANQIEALTQRLERLEGPEYRRDAGASFQSSSADHVFQNTEQVFPDRQYQQYTTPVNTDSSPGPSPHLTASRDTQAQYFALERSLKTRVPRLPDTLQIFDSRTGIGKEELPAYQVVSRCARYAEATFRQLMLLDPDRTPVTSQDLQNLVVIQFALLDFLRDEYACLLVKSNYDEDTLKFFTGMTKGKSGLSEKHTEFLKLSSELSAHTKAKRSNSGRANQGPSRNTSQFGSFNRNRFPRRDNRSDQFRGDQFQHWASRSFGNSNTRPQNASIPPSQD
jgi:hypothetical protein